MKRILLQLNLTLRALMESGIVLGLGFWGFQTAATVLGKALLGIGLPICVFAFWGLVDFRRAGPIGEVLRLLQELLISGIAAAAVYIAGLPILGWTLALLSVVHHLMVYALGDKLLKH
jgi:hypothetical protein